MLFYYEFIIDKLKSIISKINTDSKVPDISLVNQSVYDRIINKRNELDIVGAINPNYEYNKFNVLSDIELMSYRLKLRANPINVSSTEKRVITLRAAYLSYSIPDELCLIDETTISYFNYFESTLEMEPVDREAIEKLKVNKNIDYDKESILDFFSAVVRTYERQYSIKKYHLPLEYFISRVSYDAFKILRISSSEQFLELSIRIRRALMAYAYIFKKDLPADYIYMDNNIRTDIKMIENVLNNRVNIIDNPKKVTKVKLEIVK